MHDWSLSKPPNCIFTVATVEVYCVAEHAVSAVHAASTVPESRNSTVFDTNALEPQAVAALHPRSDVAVGAMCWYCRGEVVLQVVKPEQTRLLVSVRGTELYEILVSQTLAVVHARFEEVVGAVLSYSVEIQLVRLAQVRSEIKMLPLAVAAIDWYCELEQIVNGAQTVSTVVAVGFVTYAVPAQTAFIVHVLSECVPAAVLWY